MAFISLFIVYACKEKQHEKITEEVVEEVVSADGFESIFDGETLNGWDGDSTYWRVENGILVGEITSETLLKKNTFVIWKGGEPADFELKTDIQGRIMRSGSEPL